MATPNNIIAGLRPFAWRGIKVPCESASFEGGHDLAERRYPYRDAASHDPTGRLPYVTTPRLIFGNMYGLGEGGQLLYPDTWRRFKAALEDDSIGKCEHPDLGEFDARAGKWSVVLDAKNRGGITVDVTFTESVADITVQPQFSLSDVSITALAKAADAAVAAAGLPAYPTGQGYLSILEAINAVQGIATSATLSASGLANQVAGALDTMLSSIEALNDATLWPAYDNVLGCWARMRDIADRQEKLLKRAISVQTAVAATSIGALATLLGNTPDEIMGLNPGLLRSPIVPRGSIVQFYS